jgi:superfamily I DNA/RNA helicase
VNLNASQQDAVDSDGHCLITACPGSGKTRVLAHRAARLLKGNESGKLIAVTFTKDAADSLKSRILEEAGDSIRDRLAVGTLHSLALNQLKRAGMFKGLASPAEQALLMRRAAQHAKEPVQIDDAIVAIEHYKSSLEPPPSRYESALAETYHIYQTYLEQAGLMDFSDLLIKAALGMREGSIKPYAADWLLVDEAQDLDAVQMAWIDEHSKSGIETVLVADDDQSIYGWRHAMGYEGLIEFRNRVGAKLITLPINYRCDQAIIQSAAKLIGFNTKRVSKNINGESKATGFVKVLRFPDRPEEAAAMIDIAKDNPQEFAVLARTNQLLDSAELTLAAHGIPYFRAGGKSLWEKEAPSSIMGLLRAVIERKHSGILTALHFAGFKVNVIESLLPDEGKNCKTPYQVLLKNFKEPPSRVKGISIDRERLVTLGTLFDEWTQILSSQKENLLITSVAHWVKSHLPEEHIELQVCSWLEDSLKKMPGSVLQRLNLLGRRQKKQGEGVALMTLHSSKGLEWDRVWMIGVEEEVLPYSDSPIEEERRLCYVDMTRARRELYISWKESAGKSFFLEEAGLEN